ncbi:hypothetical protein FOMA001_g15876 [Fusarium oxysporum f. sp. matthiolae]|nr:hypothetical protein FOMA001_g15876 [Fusarium oxysporum f. sp. matthiolae]
MLTSTAQFAALPRLADAPAAIPPHTALLNVNQTDWRTHRLLCAKFSEQAQRSFASRPSPTHYLAIFFPMDKTRPSLVWVDTKKDNYEVEPYFHPVLDQLLHIPGNDGYIGRGLRQVQGNVLRGRTSWQNTLNLWFLDPDVTPRNITTDQAIHGTIPTLIGDTWGEFIWKGPVVAVMRKGTGYEPRHSTDITLTAYRDAIDYLGYYRDTIGSMIEPGQDDHFSKRVLADRISKVIGVRINCHRDQIARQEPQMVEVAVPKTHPCLTLEAMTRVTSPRFSALTSSQSRITATSPAAATTMMPPNRWPRKSFGPAPLDHNLYQGWEVGSLTRLPASSAPW